MERGAVNAGGSQTPRRLTRLMLCLSYMSTHLIIHPPGRKMSNEMKDTPYLLGCVHDTSIVAMLECRSERRRSYCENEAPVETLQQKQPSTLITVTCYELNGPSDNLSATPEILRFLWPVNIFLTSFFNTHFNRFAYLRISGQVFQSEIMHTLVSPPPPPPRTTTSDTFPHTW